jgi:hypothetical protein
MKSQNRGKYPGITLPGLLCWISPAVIIFLLWWPEYKHYRISSSPVSAEVITRLKSTPADSILSEITSYSYWTDLSENEIIADAEMIIKGQFSFHGEILSDLHLPFDPSELETGSSRKRLALASLQPVDILLKAYQSSRREEFLRLAKDIIIAFADFEADAVLPTGYLRNDHATAARASAIIKFWEIYRNHTEYNDIDAGVIINLASRTGQFLLKPLHFMFASNHGVMQNIALLRLALAFPELPDSNRYIEAAIERLEFQFRFYISDEGVVLEHSAGYQNLGLHLMAHIFRYLTLLDRQIPGNWELKYRKGLEYYNLLRRPDGTLPLIGDTETEINPIYPIVIDRDSLGSYDKFRIEQNWQPTMEFNLYPASGYAVWWGGLDYWPDEDNLLQTAITWSYFRGQAHKLSDEMSFHIYAQGQDWLTSAGYWPYETVGRNLADSWLGSNAPFLKSENIPDPITGNYFDERQTCLKAYFNSGGVKFIDLQRIGPNNSIIRREILNYADNLWLVLDFCDVGQDETLTTVWTFDHNLRANEIGEANRFFILPPDESDTMTISFDCANECKISTYRGSNNPYLGWQAVHSQPAPATSILIEQPAHKAWCLTSLLLHDANIDRNATGTNKIEFIRDAENWSLCLVGRNSNLSLSRVKDTVIITKDSDKIKSSILLTKGPDIEKERNEIRSAYNTAADKYPFFRSTIRTRTRITRFLLLIFIIQEIVLFINRRITRNFYFALRWANCLCWIIGGIWLLTMYRIY